MHLLVVEDDARLRTLLKRMLEEDRHLVETSSDGLEAVELATGVNGLDAIILDVGLPDISGIEVARRIRRARIDTAIIMLTARDTIADRVSGLDAGADDYLVKPFAFDELSARLRALARRREPGPQRTDPRLSAYVPSMGWSAPVAAEGVATSVSVPASAPEIMAPPRSAAPIRAPTPPRILAIRMVWTPSLRCEVMAPGIGRPPSASSESLRWS